MKITRLNLHDLRNDEFFQFMTRVSDMIAAATPAALRVEVLYGEFEARYAELDEALKKITKSAITKQIAEADAERDRVFSGMVSAYRAALNHFSPAARAAAARLDPPFSTYGNVAALPDDEQTAALYNLCKDLRERHYDDTEALGLIPWLDEAERLNRAFEALMMSRFEETTGRTTLVMRQTRLAIGEVWYRLADRIDALEIVSGDEAGAPWAAFIAELNAVVERTDNIVAMRRGRAAAKKDDEAANGNGNGTDGTDTAPAPAPMPDVPQASPKA